MNLSIACNIPFPEKTTALLGTSTVPHQFLQSPNTLPDLLANAKPDPSLTNAHIILGQPHPADILANKNLRWLALPTAGYARYDTPEIFDHFRQNKIRLTNASTVFADPCAQHVLSMILALNRQLLPAQQNQSTTRAWPQNQLRAQSFLLTGQTILILGYGTIARRLAQLLAPFQPKLYALRRRTHSEPGVHIISEEKLTAVLPDVDHLVNLLPENESTLNYLNSRRLSALKPSARLYNIGRGATLDQSALIHALEAGRLASAYLDVTTPEPLPPNHPLWTAPNCHITPHTAGGRHDQPQALAQHFLSNLQALQTTGTPTTDLIL